MPFTQLFVILYFGLELFNALVINALLLHVILVTWTRAVASDNAKQNGDEDISHFDGMRR